MFRRHTKAELIDASSKQTGRDVRIQPEAEVSVLSVMIVATIGFIHLRSLKILNEYQQTVREQEGIVTFCNFESA